MDQMSRLTKLAICVTVLSLGVTAVPSAVLAEDCQSYSEAPSSSSATTLTIIDTEVGTEAYQRLVAYGSGGHKALGMAIAGSYDFFGKCQYAGIGIMDGSGGNGYRPNFTLAIWHDGIDLSKAREIIYSLIGAGSDPVVTSGDCNISCDGSNGRQFDGTVTPIEATTTTTTVVEAVETVVDAPLTQEYAPIVIEVPVPQAEVPVSISEQKLEVLVVAGSVTPLVNSYVNKKAVSKKPIVKRKKSIVRKKVVTK
jgi:hypothetical protein